MLRKDAIWKEWQEHRKLFGGLVSELEIGYHIKGIFDPQPWHHLCGTLSDSDLAHHFDLTPAQVFYARKHLKIPAFKTKNSPGPKPWHADAGKMTDRALAQQHGVSPAVVCVYRKKMNISVFRST
jgi:hypothetical protein